MYIVCLPGIGFPIGCMRDLYTTLLVLFGVRAVMFRLQGLGLGCFWDPGLGFLSPETLT